MVGDSAGNVYCVHVQSSVTVISPQEEHKLELLLLADQSVN
jgi:hypothetical protein